MKVKSEKSEVIDLKPRIAVIGIGGAGCNAINNMIDSGLEGVEFVAANTDAQALALSKAGQRIQLGIKLTEGLGAGAKPEIGRDAAEEAIDEIRSHIEGCHMVFLAAGMGGGTGTGAISVIARVAQELDILTVAIVSKPFQFEGSRRMRTAESGIEVLRDRVDTLIVIPNQNLFRIANEKTTFAEAFILADQVLYSGIACIVDLIIKDGLINLDFADVKAVMKGMGTAMMGTGEASGENRATLAAEEAISNPLLDELSLRGARGLLVSIVGGTSLTLFDVDEAASRVKRECDPEANIIVGASFETGMDDSVRVSIVASGLNEQILATTGQAAGRAPTALAMSPGGPRPQAQATPVAVDVPPSPPPAPSSKGKTSVDHAPIDDFARALYEVMGSADEGGGGGSRNDDTSRRGWTTADGVVIEEGLPAGSGHSPPPLPSSIDSGKGSASPGKFVPRPPVDMPRRIPDLTEFPEIGQREFQAKSSDGLKSDAQSGSVPGLWRRLAGLGRGQPRPSDSSGKRSEGPDRGENASSGGRDDAVEATFVGQVAVKDGTR
ncbi:MAG: cell division protein FtsZ [Hyphomicrobiaceae bacterium]